MTTSMIAQTCACGLNYVAEPGVLECFFCLEGPLRRHAGGRPLKQHAAERTIQRRRYQRLYFEANRQRYRDAARRWRQRNPAKVKAHDLRRRRLQRDPLPGGERA